MNYSFKKPIITHIPDFLEYHKDKKYSQNTIETYVRLLNKFKIWLEKTSRTRLLPKELSKRIIEEYKIYLSKQNLSDNTQSLYLIGLRNLLSYFLEKDIPSLHPEKVKLLKHKRSIRTIENLELYQMKKFLRAPKTSTITGLRDRALLELLLATGLKLKNLIALNRDEIKIDLDSNRLELKIPDEKSPYIIIVYLPKNAVDWLRRYLQKRNDKSRALFIRYKGPKHASSRLTGRSVENIVKRYTLKTGLPFSPTPESLRNVYVSTLLKKMENIKLTREIFAHKEIIIKNYEFIPNKKFYFNLTTSKKSLEVCPWDIGESAIAKEIAWLRSNIETLPSRYESNHPLAFCHECLFRKIAILLVNGKIKVTKYKAKSNHDLWNGLTKRKNIPKLINRHGKEWHKKMMNVISRYFESQNCKVITEPILNYGRADLGVYLDKKAPLYIEVGTVSLYKLWYNFMTIKNAYFLIVPSEKSLIEFEV